jgi:two-component system, cell cycle sensor histidine kinase and response regulator CckA
MIYKVRALKKLLDTLFGPHPAVTSPEDRQGARLLAILTFLQAVLVTGLLFVVDFMYRRLVGHPIWGLHDGWIVMGGAALILASYALIRAGAYRPGAVLYVATTVAVPLLAPFAAGPSSEIGLLATAVIPIFLTAIVSTRWVPGVLVGIVVIASVRLAVAPLPHSTVVTGYSLVIAVAVTGVLVIVFHRHFSGIEKARIAELRSKESALAESEGRLRAMLANSQDMIIVVDAQYRPRHVSGAFERITGYTAAEILEADGPRRLHPDDATNLLDMLNRLGKSPGTTVRAEWRQMNKDSKWRRLEGIASNCLDAPGVEGIVLNIRDVTERADAEAELQKSSKLETVGRLAGGFAHDFNNLLTAIIGNADNAGRALEASHPARDNLDDILEAARTAADLASRLLAFSRRSLFEPRTLNLNDLIVTLELTLSRLLGEGIRLRTSLAADLGAVRVDPGMIEQVLVNLASNARDAMPRGGTFVISTDNVRSEAFPSSHGAGTARRDDVTLTITDSGSGMSEDVKRHAFEPLFTTKPPGTGTGLGLAAVYGIVQQSKGHIELDSAPGRGTTFTISIPRVVEAAPLPAVADARDRTAGGGAILLVEDEALVRKLARRTLERLGYVVLCAEDAEEALKLFASDGVSVQLLFTDLVLPRMNGRQLSEAIRRLRPDVRVLFSSGYTRDIIGDHGILDEGIAFLPKPYTPAELARRVRTIMGGPA